MPRYPAISRPHRWQHSANAAHPQERARPPQLAHHGKHGVRTRVLAPIFENEADGRQQLFMRQAEQRRHPRVLQRGQSQAMPPHRSSQPSRDPRAKIAIGVEEEPATSVPPFAVRYFRRQ
jgi:hypothetical protein